MKSITRFLPFILLLTVSACRDETAPYGSNNQVPPPPGGVEQFTYSPLVLDFDGVLTPLGNLNPPGHTVPSDHVYIYVVNFDRRPIVRDTLVRTVVAPAKGAVDFMRLQSENDWKVQFRMTENMSYYLDHIMPRAGLKIGDIVEAGEPIGQTHRGGGLDLGAWDRSILHTGFLTPSRYPDQTLHYVSPWAYFVEPLRSQIYSRLRRAPDALNRDGQIDFDVTGRLAGAWFHESVPKTTESSGPNGWTKTLAFVYDYYDPKEVRIAIGGTLAPSGVWTIPASAPRPVDVSVASGQVAYRLVSTELTWIQYGLMILRMETDERLRVEVFMDSQDSTAQFDDRAQIYLR
jgi:hypothetical protein